MSLPGRPCRHPLRATVPPPSSQWLEEHGSVSKPDGLRPDGVDPCLLLLPLGIEQGETAYGTEIKLLPCEIEGLPRDGFALGLGLEGPRIGSLREAIGHCLE